MKLIFLDIDGVLNNEHTKEEFSGFKGLDQRLVDMFIDWWVETDYKIVLSSSWRIPSAFGDFTGHLRENGISWIAETPYFRGIRRGEEIEYSLEILKPEKYVILDDMAYSQFLKHQRPFLVQTSEAIGLEEKKLKKIEELLGDKDDQLHEG